VRAKVLNLCRYSLAASLFLRAISLSIAFCRYPTATLVFLSTVLLFVGHYIIASPRRGFFFQNEVVTSFRTGNPSDCLWICFYGLSPRHSTYLMKIYAEPLTDDCLGSCTVWISTKSQHDPRHCEQSRA
jgi:hypothetical protein